MALFRTEAFTSPECRISYAQGLHKANQNDKGNDKYVVTLIFPLDKKSILQKAVADCVTGEWGEKGVERFKKGLIRNPILAGDGKEAHDKEGELRDGLGPDVVFIRAISGRPVKCFNAAVQPMDAKDVVSGFYGKAALNVFAWHNSQNGDGCSFGIDMWQQLKEGEPLGSGAGASDPSAFFEKVDTSGDGPSGDSGGASDMFG